MKLEAGKFYEFEVKFMSYWAQRSGTYHGKIAGAHKFTYRSRGEELFVFKLKDLRKIKEIAQPAANPEPNLFESTPAHTLDIALDDLMYNGPETIGRIAEMKKIFDNNTHWIAYKLCGHYHTDDGIAWLQFYIKVFADSDIRLQDDLPAGWEVNREE